MGHYWVTIEKNVLLTSFFYFLASFLARILNRGSKEVKENVCNFVEYVYVNFDI